MKNYTIIDQTSSNPLVSIAMLAYNHEEFIAQAVDSVLCQIVNFKIQIVIAEDYSTDTTRQILLNYQKKYPDKIKLILQNQNVGAKLNNLDLLSNLSGKYVAALECDDYWTGTNKLQMQIEFLENNLEYSMCFHSAVELLSSGEYHNENFSLIENRDYSGVEIYKKWTIPTASVMFRRKFIDTTFFRNLILNSNFVHQDIVLFVYLSTVGKLRGFSDNLCVYRRHKGGITSGNNNLNLQIKYIKHYYEINNVFGKDFDIQIGKAKVLIIKGLLKSILTLNFYYSKQYFNLFFNRIVSF